MKTMIVFVAALLCIALPAVAQIDPDPDGLGFYADQDGLANQLTAPPGFVEVHIVGVHMGTPQVKGWAVRVELMGNAFVTKFNTPYPSDLIYGNPEPHAFEYIVTAYPDLPLDQTELTGGDLVNLATLELYLVDTGPVDLYLGPFEDMFPGSVPQHWYYYRKGGDIFTVETGFHPSTGSWNVPVMSINGPAAIPLTPCTWSEVQALYR